MTSVLVVIPTYNEALTIGKAVDRTRTSVPDAHILVVDDASPDGTGALADELAELDDHVHVLHRGGKQGLGAAYVAGFGWGLARDYDVIVEMDADGSHQPEELPRLLHAAENADLVIGSRYVPGGRTVNWPYKRQAISRIGNTYTRVALGTALRDATGGFRAFRAAALRELDIESVASQGYCFQVDLAWRAVRGGLRVIEVPITFVEREQGESKMDGKIVREALWRVTRWGVEHRARQLRGLVGGSRR
ncbi:polyprenol monophosphomannose synthase [Jiangella alkaliphila]|uniref:Dolichol-phosphate mannosyltransferase n=1 Tax=Jiangella alkaliphila TaxID=419479 RepID=A0A1H2KUJ7_9ACTN|nr:polyprenol monophosphomannose synthase [Jiangella alkaliphila]SDU72225.1 dolichol-phosphate mannosyltransferase [Jiangella alkaliphila]